MKGATCDSLAYIPLHLRVCYDFQGVDSMLSRERTSGNKRVIPEIEQIDLATGDVIAVFKNTIEASEKTGCGLDGIRKTVQGRLAKSAGYGWRRVCPS